MVKLSYLGIKKWLYSAAQLNLNKQIGRNNGEIRQRWRDQSSWVHSLNSSRPNWFKVSIKGQPVFSGLPERRARGQGKGKARAREQGARGQQGSKQGIGIGSTIVG